MLHELAFLNVVMKGCATRIKCWYHQHHMKFRNNMVYLSDREDY